jgi:DNA-binding XRE family transcriptional regulator
MDWQIKEHDKYAEWFEGLDESPKRRGMMVTFEERMGQLTPERRAKIESRTDRLHREYVVLRKLREQLNITQEEMAQRIGVKQPAISKLEKGDRRLTLETLSEIITALGGEWELTVKLPNTEAVLLVGSDNFKDMAERV